MLAMWGAWGRAPTGYNRRGGVRKTPCGVRSAVSGWNSGRGRLSKRARQFASPSQVGVKPGSTRVNHSVGPFFFFENLPPFLDLRGVYKISIKRGFRSARCCRSSDGPLGREVEVFKNHKWRRGNVPGAEIFLFGSVSELRRLGVLHSGTAGARERHAPPPEWSDAVTRKGKSKPLEPERVLENFDERQLTFGQRQNTLKRLK